MLLLFVLTLCLFLSLCTWQILRANEKEQIISLAQQKFLLPAQLIAPHKIFKQNNRNHWEKYLYSKNKIQGKWLSQYNYLQDNVTYDGVAGYEVLTPFKTMDDTVILINRGWIDKHQYSEQKIAPKSKPTTAQTLEGIWVLPSKRFTLSDTPYPRQFPKIIQQVQHALIAQEIQETVAPLQFRLTELPANTPLSNHWQPVYGSPQKHYAYALQWFIFALILIFLFIKLNLRKAN